MRWVGLLLTFTVLPNYQAQGRNRNGAGPRRTRQNTPLDHPWLPDRLSPKSPMWAVSSDG